MELLRTKENDLFAEFLGFDLIDDGVQPLFYDENNKLNAIPHFESDWNELMKIVDKIENIKIGDTFYSVFISDTSCGIGVNGNYEDNIIGYFCDTKIEAVYNTCVGFIKWYNKKKK